MKNFKSIILAVLLGIGNFAAYAETTEATSNTLAENIFVFILVLIFFGIPVLVIIRKIRRKIRNFKEDVKSDGFGEATMNRFEDHWDNIGKKRKS
ncbi:MAG: hypothetical protein K5890_01180 [Bacteroidales bacterium]|nr:hypothetical protein [Bacteroidales bacterium]